MVISDDSYYRCCSVHVHKLAFVIGILTIVLNIAAAIANFITGTWWMYAGGFLSFICSICLLIGNRKEQSILYWPYLILQILITIGYFIGVVLFFLSAAVLFSDKWVDGYDYDDAWRRRVAIAAVILGVIYIVLAVLQIVFLVIVFRDYRYVQNECAHPVVHHHAPPPATVVAYPPPVTSQPQVIVVENYDNHHHGHHGHHHHTHHEHSGHHY
ncbi:hypothetical protein M3Y99_00460200 [Aphelenchoides fujianensis]|nr:hypothetical protein M3Y99_00460200 [Aphelenchoides fujianensis]